MFVRVPIETGRTPRQFEGDILCARWLIYSRIGKYRGGVGHGGAGGLSGLGFGGSADYSEGCRTIHSISNQNQTVNQRTYFSSQK